MAIDIPDGYKIHPFNYRSLLIPAQLEFDLRREREQEREQTRAEVLGDPDAPAVEDEPQDPAGSAQAFDLYPVYSENQVDLLAARAEAAKEPENSLRLRKLAKALASVGNLRRVGQPPGPDCIVQLRARHPHFEAVIAFIERTLCLARERQAPLRIPCILLLGEPGVGKSHFARDLAAALGVAQHTVRFDTGTENSELVGLDKQWANTEFGKLFELICLGEWANPVILLDEIDKTHTYANSNPLGALHTLLEPSTAAAVKDLSVEFVLDASLVTFLATANDLSRIPQSLQSRFRIFEITAPNAEQAIQLARQVVLSTVAEVAPAGFAAIPARIFVLVAHLTPREIRNATIDAVAAAVFNGRLAMRECDLPPGIGAASSDTARWRH